jgi:hypothetical protein
MMVERVGFAPLLGIENTELHGFWLPDDLRGNRTKIEVEVRIEHAAGSRSSPKAGRVE